MSLTEALGFEKVDHTAPCFSCRTPVTWKWKLRWRICDACEKRFGPVSADERIAIIYGTPFATVIARRSKKSALAVTRDRLHIPEIFWKAQANPDVAKWSEGRTSRTMVLHGPTGVGKSWQACGALRAIIQRRHGNAHLVNCANLNRIERATFDVYSQCTILALDDLGVRLTPVAMATAYELIDYRHSHLLPLIVTTNMDLAQISAADERIGSRLGAGTWIQMTGADRRIS